MYWIVPLTYDEYERRLKDNYINLPYSIDYYPNQIIYIYVSNHIKEVRLVTKIWKTYVSGSIKAKIIHTLDGPFFKLGTILDKKLLSAEPKYPMSIDGDIIKYFNESLFYEQLKNKQRISIEILGLSTKSYKVLIKNDLYFISDIIQFSQFDFLKLPGSSTTLTNEIISKLNDFLKRGLVDGHGNTINQQDSTSQNVLDSINDSQKLLLVEIKKLSAIQSIPYFKLKNHMNNILEYNLENIDYDVRELRENGCIKFDSFGITYNFLTINSYIDSISDYDEKLILSMRVKGSSYKEIAEKLNLSTTNVKRQLKNIYEKLPPLKEDEYKNYFVEYDWPTDIFLETFQTKMQTFLYLDDRYIKGKKNIFNLLDSETFPFVDKLNILLNKYHKRRPVEIIEVLEEVIKSSCRNSSVHLDKITSEYNRLIQIKYKENKLPPLNENQVNYQLNNTNFVISNLKKYRYYNYNLITISQQQRLKELLNLEDGFYSIQLIFDNNRDFMEEIDIENHNELFQLIRYFMLEDELNIKLNTPPHFSKGCYDRNSFLYEKIKELSPINLNDFANIMSENYGFHRVTCREWIKRDFGQYLTNNLIQISEYEISEEEVKNLSEILTKDVYLIDELRKTLLENSFKNVDQILNNQSLHKVGYKIINNHILRDKYRSIEEYLEKKISKKDLYHFDNEFKLPNYRAFISNLEKSYRIIKIGHNEYITRKKLNQIGISNSVIKKIEKDINKNFSIGEYFSLNQIRGKIDVSIIDNLYFEDIFLESIISNMSSIKTLSISSNLIFCVSSEQVTRKSFITYLIEKNGDISIYELKNILVKAYSVDISNEYLRQIILETDFYYDNIMEKIYLLKENYYEEVYNYG